MYKFNIRSKLSVPIFEPAQIIIMFGIFKVQNASIILNRFLKFFGSDVRWLAWERLCCDYVLIFWESLYSVRIFLLNTQWERLIRTLLVLCNYAYILYNARWRLEILLARKVSHFICHQIDTRVGAQVHLCFGFCAFMTSIFSEFKLFKSPGLDFECNTLEQEIDIYQYAKYLHVWSILP